MTKLFISFSAIFFLLTCRLEGAELSIEINLVTQTIRLLEGSGTLVEAPISSGAKGFDDYPYTCKATVLASSGKDKVSEYSEEYGCWMKYFIRLNACHTKGTKKGHERGIGIHAAFGGRVPPWPVSHGCIRLDIEDAEKIYNLIKQKKGLKPDIPVTFLRGSEMDLKEPSTQK